MDEMQTVGVTRTPTVPVTIESMIENAEQLRKIAPKCWHYDLITSKWLPASANGTTYACARCFKLFTVPADVFPIGEAPERISIDLWGMCIVSEGA